MTIDMKHAAELFLTEDLLATLDVESLYTLHKNYAATIFVTTTGLRKIEAEIGRRVLKEAGYEL